MYAFSKKNNDFITGDNMPTYKKTEVTDTRLTYDELRQQHRSQHKQANEQQRSPPSSQYKPPQYTPPPQKSAPSK